jgi:O-antigen/teichoic acid export membrane protein
MVRRRRSAAINSHRAAGIWALLQNASDKLITAALMFLLARLIGPTELGIAAVSTFPAVVVIAAVKPVADCIFREHDIRATVVNAYFLCALATAAAGIATTIVWGRAVSAQTGGASVQLAYWSVGAVFVASLGVIADGILLSKGQFRSGAIRRILGSGIGGAVALALALKGYGAGAYVGFLLASNLVGTAAALLFARWRPDVRTDRTTLSRAVAMTFPLVASNIVLQASARFLELISGFLLGNKAAGFARIATQISESVSSILFPTLDTYVIAQGRGKDRDRQTVDREILTSLVLSAPFLFAFCFGSVAIAVPLFIVVVLGSEWSPAILPAMILCWICLPYSIDMPVRALLKLRGDMAQILRIVILSSAVAAGLIFAGASVSIELAAIGSALSAVAASLYSFLVARRTLGLSGRLTAGVISRSGTALSLPFLLAALNEPGTARLPDIIIEAAQVAALGLLLATLVLLLLPRSGPLHYARVRLLSRLGLARVAGRR